MLRLFARRSRRNRTVQDTTAIHASRRAAVEQLEGRTLFALPAHVTSITSDNRGEVIMNTDRSLNPATITTASVLVFTYGADGLAADAGRHQAEHQGLVHRIEPSAPHPHARAGRRARTTG
jgi:hypothetical protein